MYVMCKSCDHHIPVASRPEGSTHASNVSISGSVRLRDSSASLGKGGSISFRKGGKLSFGPAPSSTFVCPECGKSDLYEASDILEEGQDS